MAGTHARVHIEAEAVALLLGDILKNYVKCNAEWKTPD